MTLITTFSGGIIRFFPLPRFNSFFYNYCRFLQTNNFFGGFNKNVLLLMAVQLRPNPPPHLELYGRRNFGKFEKKVPKKVFFSLMARQLREELLFAASLKRANNVLEVQKFKFIIEFSF